MVGISIGTQEDVEGSLVGESASANRGSIEGLFVKEIVGSGIGDIVGLRVGVFFGILDAEEDGITVGNSDG